jgi:hypothetical protein
MATQTSVYVLNFNIAEPWKTLTEIGLDCWPGHRSHPRHSHLRGLGQPNREGGHRKLDQGTEHDCRQATSSRHQRQTGQRDYGEVVEYEFAAILLAMSRNYEGCINRYQAITSVHELQLPSTTLCRGRPRIGTSWRGNVSLRYILTCSSCLFGLALRDKRTSRQRQRVCCILDDFLDRYMYCFTALHLAVQQY